MEKFLSLPDEKKNIIIDAALTAFGRNSYKKASINDIASAAGISKAMMFYYFGSKKSMYLYLADLCINVVMGAIEESFDWSAADFFDRIKMAAEIKVAALKKHPAILLFLESLYRETDREVKCEIKKLMAVGEVVRERFVFDGTDISKFMDDIDPQLVLKLLTWVSEGFSNGLPIDSGIEDIDPFVNEFYECLDMMKRHFYKNEFLC